MWALRNLIFHADLPIKEAVMELIGPSMPGLLNDPEISVQVQALNFIRNFVCHDIEPFFRFTTIEELMDLLAKKLESNTAVKVQSLYVLCNLATGNLSRKEAIMNSPLLERIVQSLDDNNILTAVAASWCIFNLSWKGDAGAESRITRFKQYLPIFEKLKAKLEDKNTPLELVDIFRVLLSSDHLNIL